MMKSLLVLFVLAASPVFAQTIERSIDLLAFGWGPLDTPISVETDGDFSTSEWLVKTVDGTNRYRVVAERNGAICVGAWFTPSPSPFSAVSLQRVGVTHKLVVRPYGGTTVTLLSLDTPVCQ